MGNGRASLINISQNMERKYIFSGNLNMKDVKHLNIRDEFLVEVLNIWVEINYKELREDFSNSPLWHNSLIKVANHSIFFRNWSKQHVYIVMLEILCEKTKPL